MKKRIILLFLIVLGTFQAQAQLVRFGLKAGPNFASVDGGPGGIDYKSRTSFHAGLAVEFHPVGNFAIQPELLYSSQGSEVDGADDFNLDYVSLPVMAKYYIISDLLSIEAGPQFSFLVNDAETVDEAGDTFENEKFDFAVAGGVGVNITKSVFAQARYTIGLTEVSKYADVTNSVFQLSVGYMF
ncbi:MAG TPA: porin family protein [Flavobacterium sp.]|jgi:hypothetical protein